MSAEDVAELLRRHDLRVTPQRRAILEAFQGTPEEHLSAEEVMSRAGVKVPEIARGTVYATLAELAELGLLVSVGNPEPVRYETNLAPHDHFRCRLCLRLFDVEFGGAELRARPLAGYAVESVTVRAEGVCAACHDYRRGLADGVARIRRRPTVAGDAIGELACRKLASPVGDLAVAASAHGIVRVAFADHADFTTLGERARSRRGPAAARARLGAVGLTLNDYFSGGRNAPADLIDWRFATPDGARALQAVQRIPYAQPLSYDRLGEGLSAYEYGYAMGSNPVALLIPCHRVSRGSERPEVYVGGAERLHFLRALEAS